ncbi:YqaJ viral recombinase family protein [Janthinobacterium sp. CG_S6]|uniref:YqaJ viral recombinase family protein n=1 Tax=Janthinobacterium sp. CG_S6 TaxID=3071707 RepID=UPI002E09C9A6|nr:putative phage-type endonuclease [Janthinobacterium sp. CG_S6]
MQIRDLKQGTPEWHAYRATHFNASDAPAMMGCSPYRTRNDLLKELAIGMAAEVDAGTQSRFDDGHRFERLSRGLAEEIAGDELYPVTGSLGRLSASFDGITMDGATVWEHKSLNKDIRDAESAAQLGRHLRIQMEQQLHIAGAKRCLFLATKWDNNDHLIEKKYFWYESDPKLRAYIVDGWAQFEADLAAYEPTEYTAAPAADPIMALPALSIQIRGEVTVSNMPMFKAKADRFIASIKTELLTDEDFANAEEAIKFCDKTEKSLELAKAAAIAQTASIDELMRTVDHISAQLREKRLLLTRTVKDKKELLKAGILNKVKLDFAEHVAALEVEIAPIRLVFQARDFAGAMKNKRTLATLQDAVDTELANGKISVDALAKSVRDRLTWYRDEGIEYSFLFADLQALIQKPDDDFKLAVSSRIDAHKAKVVAQAEAERARVQAEADAEAQRKLVAAAAPLMPAESAPVQRAVLTPAAAWPLPADPAPAAMSIMPPSLRLGQITERLGFALTAEFLRTLGFEPSGRDRAAVLYHEAQYPYICQALVHHIQQAQAKQAA